MDKPVNDTVMAPLDLAPVMDALASQGWCVRPNFISAADLAGLRDLCLSRLDHGEFHSAGVGAGAARVMAELRGDRILWVEADDPAPAARAYLVSMESLRQAVNRDLFLGLHELEAHFAAYPAGAFYKKHLDRFRDDDRRTLTAIIYLNEAWSAADGGQLRFWPDHAGEGEAIDIPPLGGTLVTFLADRHWHEVLPASRQRLALTGWFKRR